MRQLRRNTNTAAPIKVFIHGFKYNGVAFIYFGKQGLTGKGHLKGSFDPFLPLTLRPGSNIRQKTKITYIHQTFKQGDSRNWDVTTPTIHLE